MPTKYDVIIIGSGIAGYTAAKTIRELDSKMSILLVNEEDRLPYKRTSIDKNIAKGFEKEQFRFQDLSWYSTQNIGLCFKKAIGIESNDKFVEFENKEKCSYQKLLIATGSVPLIPTITGNAVDKINYIRKAADTEQIIKTLEKVNHILIIGGGVLALEMADQLVKLNKKLVIVSKDNELMQKQLNKQLSERIKTLCLHNKLSLFLNDEVLKLDKREWRYYVKLKSFTYFPEMVICSIGVKPDITLAQSAGIKTNKGIIVNSLLRTTSEDIYAAGDVAEHPGGRITELHHAAELQGKIAGMNICGMMEEYLQPSFRLKTEIFGEYFFSMNKPIEEEMTDYEIITNSNNHQYAQFLFKNTKLNCVLMANDKDNAKIYETAVRENWEKNKVFSEFKINSKTSS